MTNIVLFDQNILHYRQSIYREFQKEFATKGYKLTVCFDKKLNDKEEDDLFKPIDYTFTGFRKSLKKANAKLTIQFVWPRYIFVLFYMLWARMVGVRIILWSHGAYLMNPYKKPNRQIHAIRHFLARCHIIYSKNELKYIVGNKDKVFIANNTLNFRQYQEVTLSKDQLKDKYGYSDKKLLLSIARWNDMFRKPEMFPQLMDLLNDSAYHLVVIGPGATDEQIELMKKHPAITFQGPIYEQQTINEYYKMADLFVMPGAIGLAINQAFYNSLPIIIEDVPHSPEVCYLHEGENGFMFKKGDVNDLALKVKNIVEDPKRLATFGEHGKHIISTEGSFENFVESFFKAIEWTLKR